MLTIALDTDNFETNLNASNNNNRLDRLISIDPLRCNYYKDLSMFCFFVKIIYFNLLIINIFSFFFSHRKNDHIKTEIIFQRF